MKCDFVCRYVRVAHICFHMFGIHSKKFYSPGNSNLMEDFTALNEIQVNHCSTSVLALPFPLHPLVFTMAFCFAGERPLNSSFANLSVQF